MDRERYIAQLQTKIKLFGFTLVGVFDAENPDKPRFVYSIGLTERGWPEVILIGNINPVYVEAILTDLIKGWFEASQVIMGDNLGLIAFADGTDKALRVVDVPMDEALADYACQVPTFYPDKEPKFVQALWPDPNGVYPDEPGFSMPSAQPIIGAGRPKPQVH